MGQSSRRLNAYFLTLLMVICAFALSQSPAMAGVTTTPSGTIINSYAKVTGISGTNIAVSSTSGFAVNNRVLIIQMKGAAVNRTDTASHGSITDYGSAGRFEYAEIISVSGTNIILKSALKNSYNILGAVQIIRVPIFDGHTLSGTIVAKPWDGNTGGVVALDDRGNMTLAGTIDVTGFGFRGGALASVLTYDGCASDQFNYTGPVQTGTGNKGEGIATDNSAHTARRGRNSNGGGGGNITDAGGGGGGNVGAGGIGGRELDICDNDGHFGGIGGTGLSYTDNQRLYMGGGAGSGSEVGQAATGGHRSGGGIVFLRARNLTVTSGRILADGLTALNDDFNGSDGGAAGGAVAISVIGTITGSPLIAVRGGDGGNEVNQSFAHGTGGGGGGGAIRLFGATCTSVAASVTGGKAGESDLGRSVGDVNWGAAAGVNGNCLGNFAAIGTVPQPAPAKLSVQKSSQSYLHSGLSSGFSIPGDDRLYAIAIENIGESAAGADSLFIVDQLPGNLVFFNGDIDSGGPDSFAGSDPIAVVDNSSGLDFVYSRDIGFSNSAAMPAGFSDCAYAPVSGYDPQVRYICINPKGSFAAPGPVSKITVYLRTKIQ